MRASSHTAAPLTATTRRWNIHAGAATTVRTKSGTSTTVLATRLSIVAPAALEAVATVAISHSTESARAALELGDGAVQVEGAEIGPEGGGDEELGVRDLPEQEVGDARLTARPDEQVGVGDAVGVERTADVGFRDVLGLQLARLHLGGERAEGVQQLVATAIVEGHEHGHARVVARLAHDMIQSPAYGSGHAGGTADHTH